METIEALWSIIDRLDERTHSPNAVDLTSPDAQVRNRWIGGYSKVKFDPVEIFVGSAASNFAG
jgi:hypothetical protein